MNAFEKIIRVGKKADTGNTFVKIEWDGKRLSLTGVEGPKSNGDCRGSCGQIVDGLNGFAELAPGFTVETVNRLRETWKRWHLNDMRAGSPEQMEWLRANPVTYKYPVSQYAAATKALDDAGLNPQGARYGSKWWHEDVPTAIIEWLVSLPDTDIKPALAVLVQQDADGCAFHSLRSIVHVRPMLGAHSFQFRARSCYRANVVRMFFARCEALPITNLTQCESSVRFFMHIHGALLLLTDY